MVKTKIIGYISKQVSDDLNLHDQIGKPIVLTTSLFEHITKHNEEYESVDSYLYTLTNFSEVVNNPEYIFQWKK